MNDARHLVFKKLHSKGIFVILLLLALLAFPGHPRHTSINGKAQITLVVNSQRRVKRHVYYKDMSAKTKPDHYPNDSFLNSIRQYDRVVKIRLDALPGRFIANLRYLFYQIRISGQNTGDEPISRLA